MTRYHELRIILPLSLDEYKIGHIYTRWKLKHRENQRSDTELSQCFPYLPNNPTSTINSTLSPSLTRQQQQQQQQQLSQQYSPSLSLLHDNIGIYTHHVHLFNGFLPQWALTMLNGSVLKVHGKTWDEFPYIVSKYELPSIARANIQIDFQHFDQDNGNKNNVYNLTPEQLTRRTIEYCDICYDNSIEGNSTDPKFYQYNGILGSRGPLMLSDNKNSNNNNTNNNKNMNEFSNTPTTTTNNNKPIKTKPNTKQSTSAMPPTSSSSSSQPPQWHKQCKQYMCVYVLLSAQFDLPLAMVRNHAIDLSTAHFSSIVIELHRLAYVWIHEWDKYVVLKPNTNNLVMNNHDSNTNNTVISSNQNNTNSSSSQLTPPLANTNDSAPTGGLDGENVQKNTNVNQTPQDDGQQNINDVTTNTTNNNDDIDSQKSKQDEKHPQYQILDIFMSDAVRNPPILPNAPLQNQPPQRPRRIVERGVVFVNNNTASGNYNSNNNGHATEKKRGIRGLIQARL